jgi:anhydro-N-acetylmuramic acid kinase
VSKLTTALGLMSGTSLDGIDVALIKTDGENIVERGPSMTFTYNDEQRRLLIDALMDARMINQRDERPGNLQRREQELTEWHVHAVQHFLSVNPTEVDIIGFHGQTVIHRPEKKLTVQLGLGQLLAQSLGIPVVYDMRAADVEAGGQGAPLVPVYHRALAASIKERPVVFVNIGGVSNVTWIGSDGEMIAFDTGPGNALLDDWAMQHLGTPQDTDGKLAQMGKVNELILETAFNLPYFNQPPPKSLDRNTFKSLSLEGLSPEDGAATLAELTFLAIMLMNDWVPRSAKCYVVCGGGRHNPAILNRFPARSVVSFTAEEMGFDGDAMEAEAWAYLAVRSLKKLPLTFPGTTKVSTPITGGILAKV